MVNFPKLILCEGRADEAFLRALIDKRNLGNATIRNTSDADLSGEGRGSISLFGDLLLASTMWKRFETVTDVLIICDSDDDPDANFASICAQISSISSATVPASLFKVPDAFLIPKGTAPTIRVMAIPWNDRNGNLEVLCAPAALSQSQHAPHIATFGAATGASAWPRPNSVGKHQMRALLAVSHEPDPALGMGKLWAGQNKDEFVPLDHASFDQVADALATFLQ